MRILRRARRRPARRQSPLASRRSDETAHIY